MSTAESRRGGVGTADSRITRTAAATGPDGLTQITETAVTTRRRGRALVRAVVWWTRTSRATGAALAAAADWSARTVRPAGVLVALAATIGLAMGIAFGWVEWMVARGGRSAPAARERAVPLRRPLLRRRPVARARAGRRGRRRGRRDRGAQPGRRIALPGRIDLPVGEGLVEFGVPLLRPGHTVAQPLDIPALPRGIVTVGPATTVRSDPIGLLRREHAFDDVHQLYVHPRTTALPSTSAGLIRDLEGSPTRRLVDSDMSFHAIREYTAGDSRRQIHWKSTAKTGRLMVRQYEESRRSRMAIVLAVAEAEYADADEFELAVACAASLGLRAVRDARDVIIVTGSEIPRVVRGRLRAISNLPAAAATSDARRLQRCRTASRTRCPSPRCAGSPRSRATGCRSPSSSSARGAARTPAAGRARVPGRHRGRRRHLRRACPSPHAARCRSLTVLTVGTLDDLSGLLLRGATA